MANLSASEQVLNILKKYYVDKVDDVLLRESPILGILDRMRVEGKEFAFAVPYGASGAVSAKFLRAKNVATNGETVGNAEFTVTPGKIFSPYTMSADEVQASLLRHFSCFLYVHNSILFVYSFASPGSLISLLRLQNYDYTGDKQN